MGQPARDAVTPEHRARYFRTTCTFEEYKHLYPCRNIETIVKAIESRKMGELELLNLFELSRVSKRGFMMSRVARDVISGRLVADLMRLKCSLGAVRWTHWTMCEHLDNKTGTEDWTEDWKNVHDLYNIFSSFPKFSRVRDVISWRHVADLMRLRCSLGAQWYRPMCKNVDTITKSLAKSGDRKKIQDLYDIFSSFPRVILGWRQVADLIRLRCGLGVSKPQTCKNVDAIAKSLVKSGDNKIIQELFQFSNTNGFQNINVI